MFSVIQFYPKQLGISTTNRLERKKSGTAPPGTPAERSAAPVVPRRPAPVLPLRSAPFEFFLCAPGPIHS
jgi:hypothetical protein